MNDTAFGKSKAEIGSMLDSISSRTDKNHNEGHNSFKFLEEGMEKLSKSNEAKETFGVAL